MNARALTLRSPIIALVALVAFGPPAPAQTLRQLLSDNQVSPLAWPPDILNRRVTGAVVSRAPDRFFIAYYWQLRDSSVMADTLHVASYEAATNLWHRAAVARTIDGDSSRSLGTATNIQHTERFVYIDTHLTPSAGTLLVLDRALARVGSVYGWSTLILPGDAVVYHRSQVHVAPTHSAEVWTFDPHTKRDTLLYPRLPYGDVRRRYIDTVRALYAKIPPSWFRENNHHADPERFDSALRMPVVSNAKGTDIAFVVEFGNRESGRGRTPLLEVAVVCTDAVFATAKCAEQPLADLVRANPRRTVDDILRELVRR